MVQQTNKPRACLDRKRSRNPESTPKGTWLLVRAQKQRLLNTPANLGRGLASLGPAENLVAEAVSPFCLPVERDPRGLSGAGVRVCVHRSRFAGRFAACRDAVGSSKKLDNGRWFCLLLVFS